MGGLLLGIKIGLCLHPCCDNLVLRKQHGAHLQQLVGLLAGKLVGITKSLHLPVRTLGAVLEPFQCAGICLQRILLLFQGMEEVIIGASGFRSPGGDSRSWLPIRPLCNRQWR